MSTLVVILAAVLVVTGIIGTILPVLPGPILVYGALVLLEVARPADIFSVNFFIIFGILTGLTYVLDIGLPIWGARLYGVSRGSTIGAALGMTIGLFFAPPIGLILGAILGAVSGELIAGKSERQAIRAGLATVISGFFALALKLTIVLVMAYFFLVNLF